MSKPIFSMYHADMGGWVERNTNKEWEVVVKADVDLIGNEAEVWMHKAALLEQGKCSAMDVIKSVIYHIYKREYSGKPWMNKPVLQLPPELFTKALEQVSGEGMEEAKTVIELFKDLYEEENN